MRTARYAACAVFLLGVAASAQRPGKADGDAEEPAVPLRLGIELPQGEGRRLLEQACVECHDLAGLAAFKGYWNRERWASMVATMVEHGAELDESQAQIVVDYLTAHFGPESGSSIE